MNTEIDSLVAGDPPAFARLYDRLGGRLFAAARLLTSSEHEAEDAVQDLFVALARGRERLGAVTDLEAYLFTALRHTIFRRRRQAAARQATLDRIRQRTVMADGPDGPAHSPAPLPDEELAAAVAALPQEQREVVLLKTDGGLSLSEIAATLGVSLNTAASRWRYALAKLRTALARGDRSRSPTSSEVHR